MSGVFRAIGTAASVVAVVAAVIPGGQPIAGIASIVAATASVGAALTAKKPVSERQGLQLSFKIDPNAPIPYVVGRTAVGGTVVHRETFGTDNHYYSYFVALSLGPVAGIDQRLIDRAAVTFAGTSATGYYANWMWQDSQLGATPEARALGHGIAFPPFGSIPPQVPGWSSQHRLSGYAATSITMLFDTKARRYQNGEPLPAWVLRGNLVWDPRLDSTWPGGSGPCRRDDPATWVYSETPALHGLKWRRGIFYNGRKVMGIGAPIDLIDVARIVEAANVQEANGWKVGGELNSAMDRWEALKLIEEAGGAEPIPAGALMSTLQKMPRVPVGTIRQADILEARSIPAMKPRRERINGYRARFRSEAHGWEMVPIDIVQVAEYVAADGREHTGSGDFALVQNADQAGSLAAYAVFDSREIGPIEMVLKPRFVGYRIGDCLTIEADETGLSGKQVIVRGRRIDPRTGAVTLILEGETPEKHAPALGQTGEVPPVPRLTFDPDIPAAPAVGDWVAAGGVWQDGAYREPALFLMGHIGNSQAENVVFEVRLAGSSSWHLPSIDPPDTRQKVIRGVLSETAYEIAVSYKVRGVIGDRRVYGPVVTGKAPNAVYDDGTPINPLKPAEGGATRGGVIGENIRLPDDTVLPREDLITREGTSADTQKVGGRGAIAVLSSIDTAANDIDALFQAIDGLAPGSGDLSGLVSAAQGHAQNAAAAQALSELARDASIGARDASVIARDGAVVERTAAVLARNESEGFRNDAATFSRISAAANATRALTINPDLDDGGLGWTISAGGFFADGVAANQPGQFATLEYGGRIPIDPFEQIVRSTAIYALFDPMEVYFGFRCFGAGGVYLGNLYIDGHAGPKATGDHAIEALIDGHTRYSPDGEPFFVAASRWDDRIVEVQPICFFNYPSGGSFEPAPGVMHVSRYRLDDVTEQSRARDFAAASAVSATVATARRNEVEQIAQAVDSQLIAAQTARGGSEAARTISVQASEDAAGFATIAQSNASLSSSFAEEAAGHAGAAQGFATQADAASSSATANASLAATFRDQAAGSASSAASNASASSNSAAAADASAATATAQQQLAASHAGTAQAQAAVSSSQAAIATAQAAAAQSSAVLSARVSGGSINANSIFADYPGGNIPPGWASWVGAGFRTFGNGDNFEDGPSIEGSPWGFSQTAAGQFDSAGLFSDTPGSQGNYVVSATVQVRGGAGMGGAGVLVHGLNSAGTVVSTGLLHFATDVDINGRVLGYGVLPGPEVFRFSKMIRLDGAGIATVRIYAMTNYEGFVGAGVMQAKSLSWLRCGYRVASTAEIKTGQIDTLAATVSQQAGVLAEHDNRLRAYLDTSVIAGTSRARIGMYAESSPGVRASGIELAADAVILGNNRTFAVQDGRATVVGDLFLEGGNLIIRDGTHMTVQGPGFGEVGEFVEWFGPIMPIGECNRTNGVNWKTRFGVQRISGFQTGLLVSGNGNPALGANTSVNTGLIGSNGGAIQASASWSWRRTNVSNWAATNEDRQAFIAYMQSIGATSDASQNLWYFNGEVPAGGTSTLLIQKNGNTVGVVQSTTMLRDVFGAAPVVGDSAGQATVTETAHLAITYMDPDRSIDPRHFGAVLARAASLTNPTEQVVAIATAE